jgi:broad specificity phosphatase PhoE
MNLWEMIVVVVVIGAFVKMYLARHGIVEDNHGNRVSIKDPDADRLREEVRMLKDRLAVLERIATDNNRAADLDREIDRLR